MTICCRPGGRPAGPTLSGIADKLPGNGVKLKNLKYTLKREFCQHIP